MAKIVFTGGPGTGKTTLIKQLRRLGHVVFDDAATRLIRGGDNAPIHTHSRSGDFANKVLLARTHDFKSSFIAEPVFFDRGLPDMLGYSLFMGQEANPEVLEAIKQYRYDQIFMFPPWEAIYRTSRYRLEDFDTAVKIHDKIIIAYQTSGYSWIDMPQVSVIERVSLIQQYLNRQG